MAFKEFVRDTTDWRAMLKGPPAPVDLCAEREQVIALRSHREVDVSQRAFELFARDRGRCGFGTRVTHARSIKGMEEKRSGALRCGYRNG